MARKDPMGDLFKAREREIEQVLDKRSIWGIRLDGRSFHTFTRGFDRPFDSDLMEAMNQATVATMESVFSGTVLFGYTQSDEITIVFTDLIGEKSELPFGGRVSKILSNAASVCGVSFFVAIQEKIGGRALPSFDARLFRLNSLDEVRDNLHWRRLDARKNAVTMAASVLASHKELQGMSTRDRIDLLQGTEFEHLDEGFFNGRMWVQDEDKGRGLILKDATREVADQTIDKIKILDS